MDERLIGITAALGSAASWALGSVLFKKLGDELPPVALTFAKGVAGAALLGLVLAVTGFERVGDRPLILLILSGLLGIALGDTLFFLALRNLGAHSVVVLLTLGQVLTVLLAVVWLDERPSAVEWLGIALIMVGVTTVVLVRLAGDTGATGLAGVAWGLAAVVCMAVSIIVAKEALTTTDSIQATLVRMLAGTLGIFLFGLPTGQFGQFLKPLGDPRFAALFLLSVAVVTFGGFWLSLLAIQKVDVAVANTLGSTEPLFVLPLAAFVLRETITAKVVAGTILACLGILLLFHPW